MLFIETPRFPDNIAYGSSGGPGFKTYVFEGASGSEQRTQVWAKARGRWDVSYGIRTTEDMDLVDAFFRNTRGRAVGFRFKDWRDYKLIDEEIGTGNGVQTVFSIIKTYAGGYPYVRRIYKPVTNATDTPFVVRVDDVIVPLGSGATQVAVNYTTGILTFGASAVPAGSATVTVSCDFDVPVRFDTDQMSASHDGFETESWGSIPIVELREEDIT